MLFVVVSLAIPILTFLVLPPLTRRLGAKGTRALPVLATACLLFFVSWYVPSPLVFGQQTHASQHFIGGGLFTGFVWLYLTLRFEWRRHPLVEAASLYALVCVLGVSNELFELLTTKLGLTDLTLTDTSVDLFVNTLGALVFYAAYSAARLIRISQK